jgi:hypothetical protein
MANVANTGRKLRRACFQAPQHSDPYFYQVRIKVHKNCIKSLGATRIAVLSDGMTASGKKPRNSRNFGVAAAGNGRQKKCLKMAELFKATGRGDEMGKLMCFMQFSRNKSQ